MTASIRAVPLPLSPASAQEALLRMVDALGEAIHGKVPQAKLAVTCLAAGGHLLLEDAPGVGKTTLAEALARAAGLRFSRIQFTADLMPADVVGVQVFRPQDARFEFRPGP